MHFFQESSSCQFGGSCTFAHGPRELRDVRHNLAQLNPNYKGTLCKFFMSTGECEFGTICQYAHGNQELRSSSVSVAPLVPNMNFESPVSLSLPNPQYKTVMCKNYLETGHCEWSSRCQYAHGQLEVRTLAQNYLKLNPQYKVRIAQLIHLLRLTTSCSSDAVV